MSTILYSSCYLDGLDKSGSSRLLRTIQWARYYTLIQKELSFDSIVLLDNGSSQENLQAFVKSVPHDYLTIRASDNLKGGSSPLDYPYCWRAIHFMRSLIQMPDHKLDKIIFVDTDSYILSKRLADFTNRVNTCWTSFQSKMYGWPLTEFHILCKPEFERFSKFCASSQSKFIKKYNGQYMEKVLPFNLVIPFYNCDRFGENRMAQLKEMDFYSQRPTDIALAYNIAGL